MTRIQSSVGLITGLPTQEIVNQLMTVAARPRNLLAQRTQLLETERLAVVQLSSLLAAFKFEVGKLGSTNLFQSKQASSSKSTSLSATLATDGNPAIGSHLFTPVQTASAQQFLSQTFAANEPIGAGSFTLRTGGFVDKGTSLEDLNAGAGVQRGKIRVTDRSGASAIIDLSFARTVDDVLRAISDNTTINVSAVALGDAIRLTDNSSGSGNLSVQEVAGGTTAADLGLSAINTSDAEVTGSDVFTLHNNTRLSTLNDGNGVFSRDGDDLSITLADETVLTVDLSGAKTLGDVLERINAADPEKLSAAIAADGNRLELTDLTVGGGTFAVTNVGSGTAAGDLGLNTEADGDTLTGRRLESGLRDTLLSSLRGGQGLGTLGDIEITNRLGVTSTVDLSGAETLGDIIAAINDPVTGAAGVTAAVNSARNGITLTDTTGGTASNFIVADTVDGTETATALGLVTDAATTATNSGTLNRQTMSRATLLSSLNGGAGFTVTDLRITDSAGNIGAADLNPTDNVAQTIGDVIDRINALTTVGVEARINDTGDGILLIDTAGGSGTLTVEEVGTGTTAKHLRILGSAVEVDINGTPTQVIDGTAVETVTIGAEDTLADLVETINSLGAGITASLVNDGVGQRLSFSVDKTGAAHALLIDTTDSPLVLQEVSRARDALLLYGTNDSPGSGVLISSTTNEFKGIVEGVNLTVNDGTQEPVTISVKSSNTALVNAARDFVAAYNSIRETLDQLTVFDEEELTTGILFGTREALRIESDLSRIITSRFFGVGSFDSLGHVGISLTDSGKMELDEARLTAALASDPESVETLFTHETLGLTARFDAVVEQLSGPDQSLLTTRTDTLTRTIEANTQRVESMDARLERERARLLIEFARIETVVSRMQESLTALASLQRLPSLIDQSASR